MRIRFSLFFLSLLFFGDTRSVIGQMSNADYTKGSISINLPKSPESQSFEKYGNIPVDEYSGVPGISVPLYSVKSRSLEVPITLSYHASGIKVNQEATLVGLGFDLVCGGRITIETKGNVDKVSYTQSYREGVTRLFNKWSKPYGPYQNVSNNAIKMGYAFLDYGEIYGSNDPIYHRGDTLWDDYSVISTSAWDGDAQPDIYHASFLGNSVSFYFDLETGDIRMLGEKNTFLIYANRAPNNTITSFLITDNAGVQYYFELNEMTYFTVPIGGSVNFSTSAASAWLLTKIKNNDDEIVLSYTNYGTVKPAYTWSQSITGHMPSPVNQPGSQVQNTTSITTHYLTRVESNNTIADFTLSTRDDLEGDGSRKLDKVSIKSKETSSIVKEYLFNYDYFTASAESGDNTLPAHKAKRLRLLSVKENNPQASPWKFFYNSNPGPNKYSFAQDHWGYYNGMPNLSLIPIESSVMSSRQLGVHYEPGNCGDNECFNQVLNQSIPYSFVGNAWRLCQENSVQAYCLDSIIYPTGGSTKFKFEPHVSYMASKQLSNFVGGGLRVASIKNYANENAPENITIYDYQNSGIYLGGIDYFKVSTKWPQGNSFTLSAWGLQNGDAQTVGYGVVKKTVKNYLNEAKSGYEIKYFNANIPLNPEHVHAPEPYCYFTSSNVCSNGAANSSFYYIDKSGNGPNPKKELDGKLYKHEIYNNSSSLIKSINYYYRQAGLTNRFFSIKAEDNYLGYQGMLGFTHTAASCFPACSDLGQGTLNPMAWRRWVVSLEPATSYVTVLDSVVEKTYQPDGSFVKTKQAHTYNSFYQPEFSAYHNSDGTQSIVYNKTVTSFLPYPPVPSNGEGDALRIRNLINSHRYGLPIEQVNLLRLQNGDTLVTSSRYNRYDEYGNLRSVSLAEASGPLGFRTQFVPTYYIHNYPTLPSYYLGIDNHYKLQDSADYTATNLIYHIATKKGKKSIIWDETYNLLMASCENAGYNDIAYTSFETAANGNWSYAGSSITDLTAPTGTKVYNLGNGAVSKNSLNAAGVYMVSYWSNGGPMNVNGTTGITGRTFNGFTYYEHKISGPANGTITVSGSAVIDELRLFPEKSLMTSYTYKPLVGVSSVCDPNNRISYYNYDKMGRLVLVRDQDKKILKKVCYNYYGVQEDCTVCTEAESLAPVWQNTNTPPVCQQASCGGNTGYQYQEQMDVNPCSPTYGQTQVVTVYNPSACTPSANVTITYNNLMPQSNNTGFVATYTNNVTSQVYTFNIPGTGSGTLGCLPAGDYKLEIEKPGNVVYILFGNGCTVQSGTFARFRSVIVGNPDNCNMVSLEMDSIDY